MKVIITEDKLRMAQLGREIKKKHPRFCPEGMVNDIRNSAHFFVDDAQETENMIDCAVYCSYVYGTSLIEYGIYDFANKTHREKQKYITWNSRYTYMTFLNRVRDLHLLDNKYEAYLRLKSYYKRDAMLLADEKDFDKFCTFVTKYGSVIVKPVNLGLAEGVHRLKVSESTDLREVFQSLLKEASRLDSEQVTRKIDHRLILEEEIVPSKEISQFNPSDMSLVRMTTVFVKGKVHFFYPCFRLMCGDGMQTGGEVYSMDALIDAETGVVVTNGMNALMGETEVHPVSGIRIKGFVMPQWDELKWMLESAARLYPTIRYIGWDVVHTDKGWCIIEGNTNGEFFSQMCVGHGLKDEFEALIGFRVPAGFKWKSVFQKETVL